jgi:hypothetical protein
MIFRPKTPMDCPYCGTLCPGTRSGDGSPNNELVVGSLIICTNCTAVVKWTGTGLAVLSLDEKRSLNTHSSRPAMEMWVAAIVKKRGLYG